MAESKTMEMDYDVIDLTVIDSFSCKGTVTVGGVATLNSITLVQTLGGTDLVTLWKDGTAPTLTAGNFFFTLTYGASTFRVPCWPTT